MDYLAYLETAWQYCPYVILAYVVLTLVPKSFGRIKSFADADYTANRNKYHRCYGPDLCCHALIEGAEPGPKQKPRKAVTRVYPRKTTTTATASIAQRRTSEGGARDSEALTLAASHVIKRQVQPSAIQTHTHVNQIARMFESGSSTHTHVHIHAIPPYAASANQAPNSATATATATAAPTAGNIRKINRVNPTTILPEIRMASAPSAEDDTELKHTKDTKDAQQQLVQENLENSVNLLNQLAEGQRAPALNMNGHWNSDPMPIERRRARPTDLPYAAGTSTTPSTASPAISSSPLSSSPRSASPTSASSPVRRGAPLNLQSSLEDIFAALARNAEKGDTSSALLSTLSPVTSIDDILSQRRLSRPLSAYSISDLLVSEENEAYVESFLRTLNKA